MAKFIGVDLGGTKIAAIAYDDTTRSIGLRQVIKTNGHQGSDGVIQQMITLVRDITDASGWSLDEVLAVGVGVPAVIDYEHGRTLLLPNIPGDWVGKPVTAPMQQVLGCPVFLINDARAFTLAEATLGAGRGFSIVAGMTWGTGIGGGIAIDGKLLLGLNGGAGEFGHISIDYNGLPDGSGTPGGMEGYGSGPAIAAMAVKAVMQGVNTEIGALVNYDLNAITPAIVAQAADNGDDVAISIFQYAGRTVGAGIASVLTIVNPHVLVVGGGVAHLGERVLAPMREGLRLYSKTANVDAMKILLAALDDAGALGAALWAKQNLS